MNYEIVTIERVELETETLGSMYFRGEMIAKTMELPWKNNERSISCIPYTKVDGKGKKLYYVVKKEETSAGHEYPHFRVQNVEGRSGILWHKITYVKDLRGCVGVGEFHDINGDSVPDMINSGKTLQKIYDLLPEVFLLEIKKKGE